jgi:hypothetical protein
MVLKCGIRFLECDVYGKSDPEEGGGGKQRGVPTQGPKGSWEELDVGMRLSCRGRGIVSN